MKKILIILFICLSVNSQAQIIKASSNYIPQATSSSLYTAFYQAVLDEMTVPPLEDTLTWQNDLVYSLDSLGTAESLGDFDGYMDVFYLLAQKNSQGAMLNWVNPSGDDNITDGASTEFIAYSGFNGDGASDFLNTNFNPATEKVNISNTSIAIGIFLQEDAAVNQLAFGCTTADPSRAIRMYPRALAGTMQSMLGNTSALSTANGTSKGLAVVSRRATDDIENYMNGSSLGAATTSEGNGLTSLNCYILARNSDGNSATWSANTASVFFICKGLTDDQVAKIYVIIERYMDRIGKGS